MTVSVIIPVYNVKPYLERCVQSVLRQTYRDLEVIIVDDGSTDGCSELCDQIASKDGRIIVIHQENQGLSGARNAGICHSTGEYIIFLDSDDAWLIEDGLEQLLRANYSSVDLIVFKNVDIWGKGRQSRYADYNIELLKCFSDPQSIFSHLVRTQTLRISACFVLIKRQILIDNRILFHNGFISEDLSWTLHLWQHIKHVLFVNLNFYGYYHRNNSITTTIANTLHAYQCYNKIFLYWEGQCDQGCVNADAIRVFMANMWVSRGYCYYRLQDSEKQEALAILKQHTNLLKYGETLKVKWAATWVSFFGVRRTVYCLGLYWRLRLFLIGRDY